MSDFVEVTQTIFDASTGETRVVTTMEPAEDYTSAPTVPSEISVFQAKAVLLEYGLLGIVETFIEGSDDFTKLAWANATVWRRDSPTILTLATSLELTEAQLDEMFIRASEITA